MNITTLFIRKCKYIPKNINKGIVNQKSPLSTASIVKNLASKETINDIIAKPKLSIQALQGGDRDRDRDVTITEGRMPNLAIDITLDHATMLYNISECIAAAVSNKAVDSLFSLHSGGKERPQQLVLDKLEHERIEVLTLPVSINDKASLKGTYAVYEDIQLNFLKFSKEDFRATKDSRLQLIYRDQITIERARSVIREIVESELSFDKKDQMLLVLAQFYIKINNLQTVAIRTYQKSNKDGENLDYSLVGDNQYFGISSVTNKNPKLFRLQSLTKRGFEACNVGLFIQELKDRSKFVRSSNDTEKESLKRLVESLSTALYLEVVESIYAKAYTTQAQRGASNNLVFTTQCRML